MNHSELLGVPIEGLNKLYYVSSDGDVYSARKNMKKLSPTPNTQGYLQVHLRSRSLCINKSVPVHRLVAIAFLGDKSELGLQVDHINGIKTDNRLVNLQWVTGSYNVKKAFAQGRPSPRGNSITNRKGHRSPVSRLTEQDVQLVKSLLAEGATKSVDIAKMFNASPQCICNIKRGRNYYA